MATEHGSDIGNLYDVLVNYQQGREPELSYLSGRWADHEQWRSIARAKMFELMGYFPQPAPLDAQTLSVKQAKGYARHEVQFNTAKGVRVAGSLLVPSQGKGPFPAVVALHDHSGFYYYGREKMLDEEAAPGILRDFQRECYEGRPWASELARRGYVVLAIDGFYFGSRRIDLSTVPPDIFRRIGAGTLEGLAPGSDDYIRAYNHICISFEPLVMRHFLMAGTTWPGMMYHDDRRSVDYLLSRPEVDGARIGCCGLSLGGIRSVHLAGLDGMIKASVAAGWMPTAQSMLPNHAKQHTYMLYTPLQTAYLDFPDIASLSAPNALFIQQCAQDHLYPLQGMRDASAKLEKIYGVLGIPEKYRSAFYDNGHQFNLAMQEDAFEWLDRWLK